MNNSHFASENICEILKEAPGVSRRWGVSALKYQDFSEACCRELNSRTQEALQEDLRKNGFSMAASTLGIDEHRKQVEALKGTFRKLDDLPGMHAIFSVHEAGADGKEKGMAIRRREEGTWKTIAYSKNVSADMLNFFYIDGECQKITAWRCDKGLKETSDYMFLRMIIMDKQIPSSKCWVRVHDGGSCLVFCPVPHSNMPAQEFVMVRKHSYTEDRTSVLKGLGPTHKISGRTPAQTGTTASTRARLPFFHSIASTSAGPTQERNAAMEQERRVLEIMARQRQGWPHRDTGR